MAELFKQFKDPEESLGDLDANAAARVIAASADIAVILDPDGLVKDFVFADAELARELQDQRPWIGRAWIEMVTRETRPKAEALLNDESIKANAPRWRQVNIPSSNGRDVPILCSAVQTRDNGPVVIVGRDLRNVAMLQQRLVDAQQSMEQDYARLRNMETRYRLLFEMSSEAVLIVDAAASKVVEANPAASDLFHDTTKSIVGQQFPIGFTEEGTSAIRGLLEGVRVTGRANRVRASFSNQSSEYVVTAHMFRHEGAPLFLLRFGTDAESTQSPPEQSIDGILGQVFGQGPDGFVVTLADGQIVTANESFLAMAELTTAEQAKGESLERWLGKPGLELSVLLANLRHRDSVRLFPTTVYGEYGATTEVEVSAVSVRQRGQTQFGFAVRDIGPRPIVEGGAGRELPRSVDQMAELIGRLSLKDIVRETTDVIERLCIEAALKLSHDNRALAAEMLGLSRQSLYVKLHRFGLIESGAEAENTS